MKITHTLTLEEHGYPIKDNIECYWDGESWMSVGFHKDSSGVAQQDRYHGEWENYAKIAWR